MRWASGLVMGASLVGLAGCHMGPDYKRPEMQLEGSFPIPAMQSALGQLSTSQSAATQPATMPAGVSLNGDAANQAELAEWWKSLNDPELNNLMERAVAGNHDLRIAALRVIEARQRVAVAGGQNLPEVGVSGSYAHQRFSQNASPYNAFNSPGFPWEFNNYQTGFDAAWELDFFGGISRGIEAATADAQATEDMRRGALVTITGEVARTYVDLRSTQQRQIIVQRNLAIQRETLDLTRNRAENGVATQLDVSRAAAQVATTAAQLPALEKMRWQCVHRLAVLLGLQPEELSAELEVAGPIPTLPATVNLGVPAALLNRRPDIRYAERQLAAATARVGQATADLYPKFTLTGSFMVQSANSENIFNGPSRTFGIGPSVTVPIFEAGRLRGVVKIRSAQQEQALVRYEQTVLESLSEVHDAIISVTTEQSRRDWLKEAVAANQQSVELGRELYAEGLADFITVLDAERSLYQSQDALVSSDAAVATSVVSLYKSLGGGWDMATPKSSMTSHADIDPQAATQPAGH